MTTNHTLLGKAARIAAGLGLTLSLFATIATPPASAVGGSGLPVSEALTGAALSTPGNWLVGGDASLTNTPVGAGWLQLTPDQPNKSGSIIYNQPLPTDGGFVTEFDYAIDASSSPADGFSVFLLDGSTTNPTLGANGGALGYSQKLQASPPANGLSNGYVGIGIDEYGNFSGLSQPGIGVRGSGNGLVGYNLLSFKNQSNLGFQVKAASTETSDRRVRIRILNGKLSMQMRVSGVWKSVFRNLSLTGPTQAALPATFKVGFAGSTGALNAAHKIRNLRIASAGLSVEPKASRVAGTNNVTVTGLVSNEDATGTVSDAALSVSASSSSVTLDPSWSCSATGTANCAATGTGPATGLSLPARDGKAPVTFAGTVTDLAPPATVTYAVQSASNPSDTWTETLLLTFPSPTANPLTTNESAGAQDIPVTIVDPENDPTWVSAASSPDGSVTVQGSTISFTPNPGFYGSTTITYAVTDGATSTTDKTVSVQVAIGSHQPTATAAPATLNEDGSAAISVTLSDLNPADNVAVTSASADHGSVVIEGTNLLYTPAANFSGADTITYVISDGNTADVSNTVGVTVAGQNDAPVPPANIPAPTLALTAGQSATYTVEASTDVDGDPLTVDITTQAAHGQVSIETLSTARADLKAASGSAGFRLIYTPAVGFSGTDSFTYTVSDGHGGSYSRTIDVQVAAAPVAPAPAPAPAPRPAQALPATGGEAGLLSGLALSLVMAGLGLIGLNRRRTAR
jgi:hypothetical protein